MTKRTLFILIGIGILVLAILIFLFVGKLGNNNIQNNQPSIPNPVALPAESENSQQNIQDVEAKIKDSLNSPSSQQAVKEGIESIEFKDVQGKKIPLVDFEKAAKISINDQLSKYLDSKDYDIYYCPADGNKKDYAIYFGYNVSKAYANLYPDTLTWMKNWGKTMFSDLHTVLFPEINFSDNELNQSLKFKDGKFRYADIRLPEEKTGSINYYVSDNGVIISSSPSCVEKMIKIYEPVEP